MYNYKKSPTDIDGLIFAPLLTEFCNENDRGHNNHPYKQVGELDITDRNLELLDSLIKDREGGNIMEIGVARNTDFYRTFTSIFFKYPKFKYVGVDLEPRPIIKQLNPDAEFIQNNSTHVDEILQSLSTVGIDELDILFIDGCHSMYTVIEDWKYSTLVKSGGLVIFHDTNHHPGPTTILKAIDPEKYEIRKYFEECYDDHGMSVAIKK